ncbi:hypothetical protein CFOL_v3_20392 [Cephalotus follicularis]|uniref:DUF4408 domain-containing protein n=1 Tax=Cephalotus follicularis TaxID=3775 RepID=A0A1Q3C9M4_CEPFO|nr:hypothetical protein CFOL_v3_20392 [Cephalotus follicularis]
MDSFRFFDSVKEEKASAMQRFNRLRSIAGLFRFVELFLALLCISWTFNRLPFAVKISGDFFRHISGVIKSPLFVFLLSNGIIAALIAKSGGISDQRRHNAVTNLSEEIMKNSGDRTKSLSEEEEESREEIAYEDKQIIISGEVHTITRTCESHDDVGLFPDSNSESGSDSEGPRIYRRTKSEKMEGRGGSGEKVLRRSETEKFTGKVGKTCPDFAGSLHLDDDLSDEEFQRTVEEFIAKQLKFRRQESLSIVLPNQS